MNENSGSKFINNVVWITGASEGIGEALAHAFHDVGARLVLSSRREDELERVSAACGGDENVLVNNAGLNQRSLVSETDLHVYRKLMDVNYIGAVAMTLAVLPHMRERRSGLVVALGSPAGEFGTPLRSGYAAAKHAVHGFFESLRAEIWRDGINVSILVPGPIRTNVTINALTGDGTRFGEMDRSVASGIDPGDCSRQAVAALAKGEEQIYIVKPEVAEMLRIKRESPERFRRMVRDLAPS